MNLGGHLGGQICPECSIGTSSRKCMFYTKRGKLTRYSFACGYVEFNKDRTKNLSQEHHVYHVKGFDSNDHPIWRSFDNLGEARKFLNAPL